MSFDVKRLIKFEHNVGAKEAKIRLIAGAAAFVVSVFTAWVFVLVLALILLATGYSGWCPVYSGMNKDTRSPEEIEAEKAAATSAHE